MNTMVRSASFSLILLLLPAGSALSQSGNAYLRQPLPESWNTSMLNQLPVGSPDIYNDDSPMNGDWWSLFDDPTLDSLINIAVEKNYSVLEAMSKIEQARYTIHESRADMMPTVGMTAGWTKTQTSGNITSDATSASRERYFSGGLNASWEIDLFGRLRNKLKADKETLMADKETYSSVMASLKAQVATAYFSLREAQQTLHVIEHNCESQEATLRITEARFNAGLVSKLDVSQAKSVYYNTKSSIPSAETNISNQIATLAVLLGTYPDDVRGMVRSYRPMPSYVEPVSVGVPVDLLMRRPDVRSAARMVAAQQALLDASRSDLLPQLSVNASVGYSSRSMHHMFKKNSLTYELAPTLSWTLFDGSRRLSAVGQLDAELNDAVYNYNLTVLTAVQETDNAIHAYLNSVKQMVALREVCNQGRETLSLSLELYKQGLSPFQNVLDAQRSLLSYESSLTVAQGNSLLQLVALYKALGGRPQ